jgi:hypothetical protein
MAKDAKGHGSDTKGWGHEQHFAEAQRLIKKAASHADKREAADMRVKAREHADEANYLRGRTRAKPESGGTSTHSYNKGSVDKAIDSAYRGQKSPTAKQRAVTHALLKGNDGQRVRATTQNKKY